MKANIGSRDQSTRVFVAVLIGAMLILGIAHGTLALALGAITVVLLVTAFTRWSPLYALLRFSSVEDGISTRRT